MSEILHTAFSIDDLPSVSKELIKHFDSNRVVAFHGAMGAGKTTLIKHLCAELGIVDVVSSPTFSIVNEYVTNTGDKLYHFDFYRIENLEEVLDLGYEDYLYSGNFCFIEWPEKIGDLLPSDVLNIKVTVDDNNNRHISIVQ